MSDTDIAAIENRATLSRTTAGVYKHHGTDPVAEALLHRYTRDVHSPAIARRPGVHLYRHLSYGPVLTDLLSPVDGVRATCPEEKRLTGAGTLDYLDEAALAAFYASPADEVRAHLLADIDVIGGPPGRTTTYRTSPGNGHTFVDTTGDPAPQGPATGRFAVHLRRRGSEDAFRTAVRGMAARWSTVPGVRRLRMHLFDIPDMAVESTNGYPVYPAPADEHYQAWLDLVLDDPRVGRRLLGPDDGIDHAAVLAEVHAQPVTVSYTYVWAGRPTVVGLRGYPAWELIQALGAHNQEEPSLLEWMYGDVAKGQTY